MEKVGLKASARVQKLREKMLTPPEICVERGYLLTESYKETESFPAVIRKAQALAKILKEMTIRIDDGELIVGTVSSKPRAGALTPELNAGWYLQEMDILSSRDWDRFAPLTEEEKAKMREFLPYWEGKSLTDKWQAMVPGSARMLSNKIQSGGAFCVNNQYYGHLSVAYEKVLVNGLKGIKKQVDEELVKLNIAKPSDLAKFHFLTAVNISLEAAGVFAERYAELAASLAEKETDIQRKAELAKIAEMCHWVPANPARNFHEALQSIWFTYVVLMVEGWGTGIGFLRPDQYLFPFYKKDLEEGSITREEARELIALLYIKMNGAVIPYPTEVVKVFAGFSLAANITLGGLTEDGKDAVNDLSYLFLDAEKDVGLNSEDLVIRVHKSTPEAFLLKACEVAKLLSGKLKFVSDETIIQQLLNEGRPVEYARSYGVTGCHTPTVPGFSQDIPGGIVNLPLMLELALNNGVSRLTGEQIGPKTGDPRQFKSYDEVWEAYKKQVEALIPIALLFKNADKQLFAEFAPCPFQSALCYGCIEKGLDIANGGTAPYISHGVSLGGSPNVGDSLAAIKKVVFEEKRLSMDRLINALDRDFAGEEEVLHILRGAPKFGNDDDYVDLIVNEVLTNAAREARKVRGVAGAVSNVAAATITANIPLGYTVGALPDGRRAGEPLSEGGISPYQGRNVSGPTATMRSVAKLDHIRLSNGSVLNMRFNPEALQSEAKIRKFASLIRTFCETGGALVQFNIVGTDTLKDAQKHPDRYKDLLVRVATYSAYFVELSPELQDDIIARMEFQEV